MWTGTGVKGSSIQMRKSRAMVLTSLPGSPASPLSPWMGVDNVIVCVHTYMCIYMFKCTGKTEESQHMHTYLAQGKQSTPGSLYPSFLVGISAVSNQDNSKEATKQVSRGSCLLPVPAFFTDSRRQISKGHPYPLFFEIMLKNWGWRKEYSVPFGIYSLMQALCLL